MVQVFITTDKFDGDDFARILDSVPALKDDYIITGKWNILTITLPSDNKKKKLLTLLLEMRYTPSDIFVNGKQQPDNMLCLYDCFRPLRHTFGQLM